MDTRSKSIDITTLGALSHSGRAPGVDESVIEVLASRASKIDLRFPPQFRFPGAGTGKSAILFDGAQAHDDERGKFTNWFIYVIDPTLLKEIDSPLFQRPAGRNRFVVMYRFKLSRVLWQGKAEFGVIHRAAGLATSVEEISPCNR